MSTEHAGARTRRQSAPLGRLSAIGAAFSFLCLALPAPVTHEVIRWQAHQRGEHIGAYTSGTWLSVVLALGLIVAVVGLALGIGGFVRKEHPRWLGLVGAFACVLAPFAAVGAVQLYVATRWP
jgi:Na+/melibiose symporter-like transporter